MERITTAFLSTLGLLALSYYSAPAQPAASPDPPPAAAVAEPQFASLSGEIADLKSEISASNSTLASSMASLQQAIEDAAKDKEPVPSNDSLPGFDSGGSDADVTNTPTWQGGSNSPATAGGGSSGGYSSGYAQSSGAYRYPTANSFTGFSSYSGGSSGTSLSGSYQYPVQVRTMAPGWNPAGTVSSGGAGLLQRIRDRRATRSTYAGPCPGGVCITD